LGFRASMEEEIMVRIAILDDYQSVALEMAPLL
jgi:hypothetical protein